MSSFIPSGIFLAVHVEVDVLQVAAEARRKYVRFCQPELIEVNPVYYMSNCLILYKNYFETVT
jgi:hypothetical protein